MRRSIAPDYSARQTLPRISIRVVDDGQDQLKKLIQAGATQLAQIALLTRRRRVDCTDESERNELDQTYVELRGLIDDLEDACKTDEAISALAAARAFRRTREFGDRANG
jgi:hypothetical protein